MICKDCIHFEVCGFTSITGKTMEKDCKQFKNKADFVEIVRCKDCKSHSCEQEPEHGKTTHLCSVLNAEVFKDFYCYHGTPKESEKK